jgi:beta-mannosidase
MTSGRHCLSTPAGVCATPATLPDRGWIEATVPGTAAGARRAAGLDPSGDHHAQDHWFALDCQLPPLARLECEGLAILPEVWLDGTLVAGSESMFRKLRVAVPSAGAQRLSCEAGPCDAGPCDAGPCDAGRCGHG